VWASPGADRKLGIRYQGEAISMAKKVSWVFDAGMLFNVACDHAQLIEASPREGNQKGALVSIVFSLLTLEAFLNELAEFAYDTDVSKPEAIDALADFLIDAERSNASLETKLAVGNWILTGARFKRGEQPFQDFALLVRLRNDLVHFKANARFENGVPTGRMHANLLDKFRDKKILAENLKDDELSWSRLVQTKAVAEWSCKTVARMVTDLCNKIPPDFRHYLRPSEQFYDPDRIFSGSTKLEAGRKVKHHCPECGWESEGMPDTGEAPFHECKLNE
jgi:hypothetical protein